MGKGQLLFLVGKAGRCEAEHLQGAGYRFATLSNVVPILAASMQVSRHDFTRRFDNMRDYVSDPHMLDLEYISHVLPFVLHLALGEKVSTSLAGKMPETNCQQCKCQLTA